MNVISSRCGSHGCWEPSADVYRTDGGWLIKFDLAGVNPTEIELKVEGNRLTIRGTRRDAILKSRVRLHSLEINYNRFERSLELPVPLHDFRASTEYIDGMLLVWLNSNEQNR